jgi:hypothetical protein
MGWSPRSAGVCVLRFVLVCRKDVALIIIVCLARYLSEILVLLLSSCSLDGQRSLLSLASPCSPWDVYRTCYNRDRSRTDRGEEDVVGGAHLPSAVLYFSYSAICGS